MIILHEIIETERTVIVRNKFKTVIMKKKKNHVTDKLHLYFTYFYYIITFNCNSI